MGVSGLFRYCERHRDSTSTRVDLLKARRSKGGVDANRPLELLVDLLDFETLVVNRLVERTARRRQRDADMMMIFGVDFEQLHGLIQVRATVRVRYCMDRGLVSFRVE